jgi:hypothetical protein
MDNLISLQATITSADVFGAIFQVFYANVSTTICPRLDGYRREYRRQIGT